MAGGPSGAVLRDIQTLFDAGTSSGLSDRQLLERFTGRRDASAEAAFEVLVCATGRWSCGFAAMCWAIRPTPRMRFRRRSWCWLGGAVRFAGSSQWEAGFTAWRAGWRRERGSRRPAPRGRTARGALRVVQAVDPRTGDEPGQAEFGPVIQEEVRRLPEKYRAVVALCYWEGLTHEQAATQLGCPLGTVRSRLARARDGCTDG